MPFWLTLSPYFTYFCFHYNSTHSFTSDTIFFCRLGHQFFFLACVPSPFTPRTNIKAILNYKATYTYDFSPSEIARFIDCHVIIVESLLREITGFLCLQKKIKSQKFDNANMYVV